MSGTTYLLIAATLVGQCPGGRCGIAAPAWEPAPFAWAQPAATPIAESYRWQEFSPADPDQVQLRQGNRQVGVWSRSRQRYAERLGPGQFGPWVEDAPIPPPGAIGKPAKVEPVRGPDGQPLPTGVVSERISDTERVTFQGREITQARAADLIGGPGGQLDDDSEHAYVTLVSADAGERQRWLETVGRQVNDHARVHAYDPADPMIASLGFEAGRVYVQRSNREVLLNAVWDGSPATVTAIVEGVRKADPKYDPTRDPDGRLRPLWPKIPDLSGASSMLGMIVIGLTCPLLFLLLVIAAIVVLWRGRS